MHELGAQEPRLTELIARDLQRHGIRPRRAWRDAAGLSQQGAAERFDAITGNPRAPMSSKRIRNFEAWPDGGIRPTDRDLPSRGAAPAVQRIARLRDRSGSGRGVPTKIRHRAGCGSVSARTCALPVPGAAIRHHGCCSGCRVARSWPVFRRASRYGGMALWVWAATWFRSVAAEGASDAVFKPFRAGCRRLAAGDVTAWRRNFARRGRLLASGCVTCGRLPD